PETGAALAAALAAGHPADVDYRASFVDGAGSRRVLDSMWPLVTPLVDAALAIPIGEAPAAGGPRARAPRGTPAAPGRRAAGGAGAGRVVGSVAGGTLTRTGLPDTPRGAAP